MIPLLPPLPISAEEVAVIIVACVVLGALVALLVKAYEEY